MVNEDSNVGEAERDQVSAEIERDTARGLWNKPNPDDEDDDEY